MVKSTEKQATKSPAEREVSGVRKPSESGKKPPPGKPYVIKKTWL